MGPDELRDFHYITHVSNLDSILEAGILSHRRASDLDHESVANERVQARREVRRFPTGLALHDYANLYLDARNAMMYRISMGAAHKSLCVVEVSKDVLTLPGVVVTDGNASCGSGVSATRVFTPDEGVHTLLSEDVYRHSWSHSNPFIKQELKRKRMAEVLVPHHIPPQFFRRVLVSCAETESMLLRKNYAIIVQRYEHLFFR